MAWTRAMLESARGQLVSFIRAPVTAILVLVLPLNLMLLMSLFALTGYNAPTGLVVGEDPELDAQRFRRTDNGICLITQPMIDRLGQ